MRNRTARVITTYDCPKKCEKCSNKALPPNLPIMDFSYLDLNFDSIVITGGEPLLYNDKVKHLCDYIKNELGFFGEIYMYTSMLSKPSRIIELLKDSYLDGITVSINDKSDLKLLERLTNDIKRHIPQNDIERLELRLNMFTDVKMLPIDLRIWNVKFIEWKDECLILENETLFELEELWENL